MTARDALVRDHCFGLGLLFGFHKAESEAGTETLRGQETFARDTNVDSTATKDRSSYLKEDPEKAAEEDPKIPTTQDTEEDIRKRLFIRPRPLFLTISVPTNHNFRFLQVSYCFRRSCYGKRILVIRYLSLVLFCKTLMTKSFSPKCSMYPPSNFK